MGEAITACMWGGVAVIVITDLGLIAIGVLHIHADWMRARVQYAEWKAKRGCNA